MLVSSFRVRSSETDRVAAPVIGVPVHIHDFQFRDHMDVCTNVGTYVYTYVFEYVCRFICKYVYIYTYVCVYECEDVSVYVCIYLCECMCVLWTYRSTAPTKGVLVDPKHRQNTRDCPFDVKRRAVMYVCMWVCMYIRMCVCVCVYVYTYVCMCACM